MSSTIEELYVLDRQMKKIVRINVDMMDFLVGSTVQFLRCADKNNLEIINREKLHSCLLKARCFMQEHNNTTDSFNRLDRNVFL